MSPKRIFMPEIAAKQLQGLPADTRLHVEACLENLDVHMATAQPGPLMARLVRFEEGFMADAGGASVFFTVDVGLRTAFIRRIELSPPAPGSQE
jgi:hypothetical protein